MQAAVADGQRRTSFHGVPSFFRGLCMEAQQGGTMTYLWAGHEFARHLVDLLEHESSEELARKCAELTDALKNTASTAESMREGRLTEGDEELLQWLEVEFPRCMQLVPRRRRAKFLEGFFEADENGLIELGGH